MARAEAGCRLAAPLMALIATASMILLQACGSTGRPRADHALSVRLPAKTLELAISPAGKVLAETASGVYVLPRRSHTAARRLQAQLVVNDRRLAISRLLTVARTDSGELVGSSHPDDPRTGSPENLGLLASRDDGNTWQVESLYGSADLHILRPAGATLYAVDFAHNPATLMITNDYGRTWTSRQPPGQITDIAVDPDDPSHAFALTDKGLLVTHDQANSWRPGGADTQALVWAPGGPLYLGGADGTIQATSDEDRAPQTRGNLDTGIEHLTTGPTGTLWALGTDRSIRSSTDSGRHWTLRYHLHER